MPAFAIRFDEQQLLDMAAKARLQCSKKAYLHKSDAKLSRLKQRWCCIYQNMLFYFESESIPKPVGVGSAGGVHIQTSGADRPAKYRGKGIMIAQRHWTDQDP